MRNTLLVLCLMSFIAGCGTTETITVTRKVGTLPPGYLYQKEPVPSVPEGVPPDQRTDYLLEGYASRGDAIRRANARAARMALWVEYIRKLYPETTVQPLPKGEGSADNPEGPGKGDT